MNNFIKIALGFSLLMPSSVNQRNLPYLGDSLHVEDSLQDYLLDHKIRMIKREIDQTKILIEIKLKEIRNNSIK